MRRGQGRWGRTSFGPSRRRALAATLCLASAVVLGVLPTSSASAARGLETGFGEYFFESEDASERTLLFDSAREAGAGIVRLDASWRQTVRSQPVAPRDPNDLAYDFSRIDSFTSSENDQFIT